MALKPADDGWLPLIDAIPPALGTGSTPGGSCIPFGFTPGPDAFGAPAPTALLLELELSYNSWPEAPVVLCCEVPPILSIPCADACLPPATGCYC